MHAVAAGLPAGELLANGQAEQEASDVAPTAVENFPVPQSTHVALPTPALCLPATHAVHSKN
jgi:hypothetical protein